nr:ulp1 protease family, C-terminal catalytic domain-containing protein [Tanacetum cinerariifolium]
MMIEFCKQYEELFNDNEFNVSESSMDDYRDGDGDAYDNNKKDDDERATMADRNKKIENENEKKTGIKKKENRDENGTGIKEGRTEAKDDGDDNIKDKDESEAKDDGHKVKDNVNNKNDFENLLRDDTEDEVLMDIDIPNEEMKQKEADKEKVSDKNGNESEKEKQYEADKVKKTKDVFKWKKENGEYDEKKQFEAFSKKIKSEFKKDPEMKNMKDLEMKKLFSMHLEKVEHPRAKGVLNKNPTFLRPKWGTKENDTDCGIFMMMHMEHYNGETAKN